MKGDRKTAAYLFTDREEPVEAFWKNYNAKKNGSLDDRAVPRVLNYYGIGGIGKTTLLKKLMEEMRDKTSNPRFVHWDFKFSRERSDVLQSLKTKLEDKYDFAFPLFSLAMYAFMRKTGKPSCAPEIKALIDSSPFLKSVVDIVGEIPTFGMTTKLLVALDRIVAYGRNWYERNERDLIRIEGSKDDTPDVLYDSLAYYFAKDVANNLEATEDPFVFLLDGYETLVNEKASTPLGVDEWIRGGKGRKGESAFIRNVPNTLWVVAGNEKLRWIEKDPYWEGKLEQHLLDSLSKEDTFKFLSGIVVREKPKTTVRSDLYEGLYALTKGVPLYLDLCIDRYTEITEEGREPSIADFGKDTDTLLERFIGEMDDGKRDILYMLSCMYCWNDDLIKKTSAKILDNFSLSAFNTVRRLSFIMGDSERETMHPAVSEVLFRRCSEDTPSISWKAKNVLAKYYEEKIAGRDESSPGFEGDLLLYARYTTARGTEAPEALYREKFRKFAKRLTESYKLETALDLLELFWRCAERHAEFPLAMKPAEVNACMISPLVHEGFSYDRPLPESVDKASLAFDYALVLYMIGRYNDAVEFYEFADNEYRMQIGKNHSVTLKTMNNLAATYSALGRHKEALELQKELADTYSARGQHKEALEFQRKMIEKERELLGEEHRDALMSMSNLAITYLHLGRYEEALALQDEALAKTRKVLGEDDPVTLQTMNNLAGTYSTIGRHEKAFSLYEDTLVKMRQIHGNDHPHTLLTMNGLAFTYSSLGRYDEALKLHEETLAKMSEILGKSHPDTLTSMNNLALTYSGLHRQDEALTLHEETIEKRRLVLGEEHPDTLTSKNNLAETYSALGRHNEALALHKKTLAKKRKVLGEKHPDTLVSMNNLAETYSVLDRHEEALALQKKILTKRRKDLGKEHPCTLTSMNNLASTYSALSHHEEALALYKEMFEKKRNIMGEEHPDTLTAMDNLASTYSALGRHDEALPLYEEALANRRKTLGEDQPDTLTSMNLLASTYSALGRHEKALLLHEETLAKRREILGEDHPDTFASMNNLASTYSALGRHEPDTLASMNHLASNFSDLGHHEEARALYEETLPKRREILGEDHPDTLTNMNNLASTYSALGRHEEALPLYEETLAKRRKILGEEHFDTIASIKNLASTYSVLGRYNVTKPKTTFGGQDPKPLKEKEGGGVLNALKRFFFGN